MKWRRDVGVIRSSEAYLGVHGGPLDRVCEMCCVVY